MSSIVANPRCAEYIAAALRTENFALSPPRSPALPGKSGSSFFHWSSRSSFLISCIFGIRFFNAECKDIFLIVNRP